MSSAGALRTLTHLRWRASSSGPWANPLDQAVSQGRLYDALDLCRGQDFDTLLVRHLLHVELGHAEQSWWHLEQQGDLPSSLEGKVLGLKAFALQMGRMHSQAEASAARSLSIDPADPWALLALLEVYEKEGRNRQGLRLLRELEDHWQANSPFKTSFGLRRSLFFLDLGKVEGCLKSYERVLYNGSDFEGPYSAWALADASALFWRLSLFARREEWDVDTAKSLLGVERGKAGFDVVQRAVLASACGESKEALCGEAKDAFNEQAPNVQVGRAVVDALSSREPSTRLQSLRQRGDLDRLGGCSLHCDALELAIASGQGCEPSQKVALARERVGRRPNSPQSWMLLAKALGSGEHARMAELRARDLGFEQ